LASFQTLWDLLDHAADRQIPLRIHGEPDASWEGIRRKARGLASQLIAAGCPVGARIIVSAQTRSDFFIGFFGSIAAGALAVPCAPDIGRRPLTQIPERLDRLDEHLSPWGWFGFAESPDDARRWLTMPTPIQEPIAMRLGRPEETAYLQLTSGTTTGSRATMVSHRQALANMATTARGIAITPDDRVATWLPLYHDYGLVGGVLTTIHSGTPVMLHPPAQVVADPAGWLEDVARERITLIHSGSFMLGYLLRRVDPARLERLDLSHLRMFVHGGERLDAAAFRQVQAILSEKAGLPPNSVVGGYGLAESTFCASTGRPGQPRPIDVVAADPFETEGRVVPDPHGTYRFVSVGPVLDAIEARIVGSDGHVVSERRIGEIQLRGESITAGYWQDPEGTAALFQDGWLKTGDLGYLADDHLYVTGRIKEIIIQAGRNYLPQDIEEVVEAVPGVRKAGSVALGVYDHDLMTESLVLLVEVDAQNLPTDISARIHAAVLGQFGLTARRIILLQAGSIPKTTSGKRQRTLCRQWVLNDRIPPSLICSV
jgi:acyl-CoA synthetase (AMP-forming)/AMP-acid ligase II